MLTPAPSRRRRRSPTTRPCARSRPTWPRPCTRRSSCTRRRCASATRALAPTWSRSRWRAARARAGMRMSRCVGARSSSSAQARRATPEGPARSRRPVQAALRGPGWLTHAPRPLAGLPDPLVARARSRVDLPRPGRQVRLRVHRGGRPVDVPRARPGGRQGRRVLQGRPPRRQEPRALDRPGKGRLLAPVWPVRRRSLCVIVPRSCLRTLSRRVECSRAGRTDHLVPPARSETLALLLHAPDRADWKRCAKPDADEKKDAQQFKAAFKSFDPSS